jgi:Predicted ATPase
LSAASRIDDDDMLSALSLLEQADIIYRVGISPVLRFAFKHVLLRDAIYDSLLRSKRQQIHADIAAILEHDFRSSPKINPKSWPITIKKQAITNWPFVAGSSLGRARSRIPPTSKRLLAFERPFSFWTLCRKRLSGSNKRSTFNWRWEYRLSPFKGMPPRKPAKRFRGLVPYACDSATSPNISKPCLGYGGTPGWVERMMMRSA